MWAFAIERERESRGGSVNRYGGARALAKRPLSFQSHSDPTLVETCCSVVLAAFDSLTSCRVTPCSSHDLFIIWECEWRGFCSSTAVYNSFISLFITSVVLVGLAGW